MGAKQERREVDVAAASLTPEPKQYPPQQVRRVRPGEDFSVDFNLDPERVKALNLAPDPEDDVYDVVRFELEGVPVSGQLLVVEAYSGPDGMEYPAVLLEDGKFVPAYLLDVCFDNLPEGIAHEIRFSISPSAAETLSAKMSVLSGSAEGVREVILDCWRVPDEDSLFNPVFSQHDLSGIKYRVELPPEAPLTP